MICSSKGRKKEEDLNALLAVKAADQETAKGYVEHIAAMLTTKSERGRRAG